MKSRIRVALLGATATCVPSLGPGGSLVTSSRILAVRAEPAETKPGARVTFTALVAGPDGTVADAAVGWSFCTAPKPLTEDNVVSDDCLGTSALARAGAGPATTATIPGDACSVFGPATSSSGGRPRDPDATGGYYQPLRLDLAGAPVAFALARVQCDLANADAATASAFAGAYRPNQNPALSALTAAIEGRAIALTQVPAGSRVTLEASWPAASAETFAYFDGVSQTVVSRREELRVAWYASGGALDTESTGRSADDPATSTANGWTAPESPGTFHLWVVLRDSRGGMDWSEYELVVK